jgi:hypothetical protein
VLNASRFFRSEYTHDAIYTSLAMSKGGRPAQAGFDCASHRIYVFRLHRHRIGDGEVRKRYTTFRFTSWYNFYEESVRGYEYTKLRGGGPQITCCHGLFHTTICNYSMFSWDGRTSLVRRDLCAVTVCIVTQRISGLFFLLEEHMHTYFLISSAT